MRIWIEMRIGRAGNVVGESEDLFGRFDHGRLLRLIESRQAGREGSANDRGPALAGPDREIPGRPRRGLLRILRDLLRWPRRAACGRLR